MPEYRISTEPVRYYQDYVTTYKESASGHTTTINTPVQRWNVTGPAGHISRHTSEENARRACESWTEFYKRHPHKVLVTEREKNLQK